MTWIIHPCDVVPKHRCDPPGKPTAVSLSDFPQVRVVASNVKGGLWQCECGQHWQGKDAHQWWPISARAARRAKKRHDRR